MDLAQVFYLSNNAEMEAAIRSFRNQLGPGRFTGPLYISFIKAVASNRPIGVDTINQLKAATALFGLPEPTKAKLLETAAEELSGQPSVLGKLVFLAERVMPQPAAMAKLRTKFPNWSLDTVTALQQAMLQNLYRDMIADQPPDAPPDMGVCETLGLSAADAKRLQEEVAEAKAVEAAEEAEKAAEEERVRRLEEALKKASEYNTKTIPTRSTTSPASESDADTPQSSPPAPSAGSPDDAGGSPIDETPEDVTRDSNTHEYECTNCGYVLFPAAGREFKFFGADFTCPGCGAGKDSFVDNGPVE